MGGESGLHTARTGRGSGDPITKPRRTAVQVIILLSIWASACVYFNALYNANRLFDQGQNEIEAGRTGAGRVSLRNAIEKAERIVTNNPDSRWADDSWRLITRARLLREEWAEAAEASSHLLTYAENQADSAEVAGYMGRALVHLGDPQRADSLLTSALGVEQDARMRARLLHGRGAARAMLGRFDAAVADLSAASRARPGWLPARVDLIRLLVDQRRSLEAAAEMDSLIQRGLTDAEERSAVRTIEYSLEADPDATSLALQAVESSALSRSNRAYLVKLRGDLHAARGEYDAARADYEQAARLALEDRASVEAELALIRLEIQRVSTVEELNAPRAALVRLSQRPAGRFGAVRDLRDTFIRIDYWLETGGLGLLLAAETARDVLHAPALARTLFLRYADEEPGSLWAAKAILAALDLYDQDSSAGVGEDPVPDAEELRRRLREDHRDSPYVGAVLGTQGESEAEFTYQELELGLRRQLDRLASLAEQEVEARRAPTR